MKNEGVLAVVDDLMFASKIDGLGRAHGVAVVTVRTMPELETALAGGPLAIAFVDLSLKGMDALEAIARVRRQQDWASVAVVAFGSHVDRDRLKAIHQKFHPRA